MTGTAIPAMIRGHARRCDRHRRHDRVRAAGDDRLREASDVPGQVGVASGAGCEPGLSRPRLAGQQPRHWAHGITMGAARGLLDLGGLRGPAASAATSRCCGPVTRICTPHPRHRRGALALGPDELVTDLVHKGSTPPSTTPWSDITRPCRCAG